MTEQPEPIENTDPAATPEPDTGEPEAPPRSKDARNRVELRETRARLERLQRREIERIAAEKMADAADLWTGGVTVDDVLDDQGDIDDDKVHAAVDGLLEQRPHWAAPKPEPHKRHTGLTSGAGRPRTPPSNWAAALRGDGV